MFQGLRGNIFVFIICLKQNFVGTTKILGGPLPLNATLWVQSKFLDSTIVRADEQTY